MIATSPTVNFANIPQPPLDTPSPSSSNTLKSRAAIVKIAVFITYAILQVLGCKYLALFVFVAMIGVVGSLSSFPSSFLLLAIAVVLISLYLAISSWVYRFVFGNWKTGLLAAIISGVLCAVWIAWLFANPNILFNDLNKQIEETHQEAEVETNKYLDSYEVTQFASKITNQEDCTSDCDRQLEISFDLNTPHEGLYQFIMDTYTGSSESEVYKRAVLLPSLQQKDVDFGESSASMRDSLYLKPGLHHLTMTISSDSIVKRKVSGPTRVDLLIWLNNEESERAKLKNDSVYNYTVFDEKTAYLTDSHNWFEYDQNETSVAVQSVSFDKSAINTSLGTITAEITTIKPGTFLFQASVGVVGAGESWPFDYLEIVKALDLPAGTQTIKLPMTLANFLKTDSAQASMQNVSSADYNFYKPFLIVCEVGTTQQGCSPGYDVHLDGQMNTLDPND